MILCGSKKPITIWNHNCFVFNLERTVMKKVFFQLINKINKALLPRYSKENPEKLTKLQQAIVGFRYYVLINSKD